MTAVERFRAAGQAGASKHQPRNPIARDEWVVLGAAAPTVLVTPFLLGGMVWWAQVATASMQALVFFALLVPWPEVQTVRTRFRRLVRFPPFWLGGLFLIYLIIQALNPSWQQVYLEDGRYFIAERKPEFFVAWLPQSIYTNFYVMNAWRHVIFWAGAWAFVCGLWVGLRSRRAWLALAWLALGTGALLGIASMLHHLSANEHLFWVEAFERRRASFGPFVYRNQGAVYWYLCMALGLSLFLHLMRRGHLRSGLPWMALFLSGVCFLAVLLNASRGGWVGAAGVGACFLVLLPFTIRWRDGFSWGPVVGGGVLLLAMAGIGAWSWWNMDFSEITQKWGQMKDQDDLSIQWRVTVSKIAWEMFEDRPWFGWGAGSFLYRYPYHALSYPELYYVGKPEWHRYGEFKRQFHQAHNDHFQFLAEYGMAGCSLLVLCGAWWVVIPLIKQSILPEWLMAAGASVVFLAHNFGDFFLQNSIDLQAWLVLLVGMSGVLVAGKLRSDNDRAMPA